jgi:hypothetical protein
LLKISGGSRIALAALAVAGLAAACGNGVRLHAETDFPMVRGARVVAHDEGRTDFGPQFETTLVVLGPRGTDAQHLMRKERALVRREDWKRHVVRQRGGGRPFSHPYVYWSGPPADSVSFGRLSGPKRHQVPHFDRRLAHRTPGPLSRKIYVEILPPESQPE